MSEWFEDFSDNIEENAGYYAAAGGMMHLRNQDAQKKELQKQRRILEQQARDAKAQAQTEKERLAIEKKRFDLEQKEKKAQVLKTDRIKDLRKQMAQISSDIGVIEEKFSD